MHDTLAYFHEDPIHRRYHHNRLTFRGLYMNTEYFVPPLSHDEVVHGKWLCWARCPATSGSASPTCAACWQPVHPTGQEAAVHGQRAGAIDRGARRPAVESRRRAPATARPLPGGPWTALPRVPRCGPPIRSRLFAWIDASDVESSVFSYIRRAADATLVVVQNLTPVPRSDYQLGVPRVADGWRSELRFGALRRIERRQPGWPGCVRRAVARAARLAAPGPAPARHRGAGAEG